MNIGKKTRKRIRMLKGKTKKATRYMNTILGRFNSKSKSKSKSKSSSSRSSSNICLSPLFSVGDQVRLIGDYYRNLLRRHKISPNIFVIEKVEEETDLTGRCKIYFYDIKHRDSTFSLDSESEKDLEKV